MKRLVLLSLFLVLSAVLSSAQTFHDDFEFGLVQWTGKSGGPHHGIVVADPLNPANHVLSFDATVNTGDIFSPEIAVSLGSSYILSFDYLGVPVLGTPADDTGGMIGISNGTPGDDLRWFAGTIDDNYIVLEVIDDGQWHSYSITFDAYAELSIPSGTLRITLEDWDGAACVACTPGVSGDAFFDNVRLQPVGPVPADETTWGRIKTLYN